MKASADWSGGVWSCKSCKGASCQGTEGVVARTGADMNAPLTGQQAERIDAALQILHASFDDHAGVRSKRSRVEPADVNGTWGVGGVGQHVEWTLSHGSKGTPCRHVGHKGIAVSAIPCPKVFCISCTVRFDSHRQNAALGAPHHFLHRARYRTGKHD